MIGELLRLVAVRGDLKVIDLFEPSAHFCYLTTESVRRIEELYTEIQAPQEGRAKVEIDLLCHLDPLAAMRTLQGSSHPPSFQAALRSIR